ncbi:unnamed protein product [Notodromas monacha]|uniref:Uncharacterized protein n=1 Tax=Notodromas monacha TaxID=399045 RepID=A0A7R9BLW4_9CRUS|nr:unnamed protein product [Notodromas monacha]CAG0916573.1 unnamed protein product [Notodromas monacha]
MMNLLRTCAALLMIVASTSLAMVIHQLPKDPGNILMNSEPRHSMMSLDDFDGISKKNMEYTSQQKQDDQQIFDIDAEKQAQFRALFDANEPLETISKAMDSNVPKKRIKRVKRGSKTFHRSRTQFPDFKISQALLHPKIPIDMEEIISSAFQDHLKDALLNPKQTVTEWEFSEKSGFPDIESNEQHLLRDSGMMNLWRTCAALLMIVASTSIAMVIPGNILMKSEPRHSMMSLDDFDGISKKNMEYTSQQKQDDQQIFDIDAENQAQFWAFFDANQPLEIICQESWSCPGLTNWFHLSNTRHQIILETLSSIRYTAGISAAHAFFATWSKHAQAQMLFSGCALWCNPTKAPPLDPAGWGSWPGSHMCQQVEELHPQLECVPGNGGLRLCLAGPRTKDQDWSVLAVKCW